MTAARRSERPLLGRTALVTGATRGIGNAVAARLLAAGAQVVLTGRREDEAERAAADLQDRDPGASGATFGVGCEVRDRESVAALAEVVENECGGLDILVNNAGFGLYLPTPELPTADFARVVDTNLVGAYRVVRACLPLLLEAGERGLAAPPDSTDFAGAVVVNLGSLAGRHPFRGGAAYNASKFGLIGLTEALMLDLRDRGVRCSVVMPGSVATGFAGRSSDAGREWKLHPEDVAEAVLQVVLTRPRAHQSRIELRPAYPPTKKP